MGLIDREYPTDGLLDPNRAYTPWERFKFYVRVLNRTADTNNAYKVFFITIHGESAQDESNRETENDRRDVKSDDVVRMASHNTKTLVVDKSETPRGGTPLE